MIPLCSVNGFIENSIRSDNPLDTEIDNISPAMKKIASKVITIQEN